MKFKTIKRNGKVFLYRVSIPLKKSSIKIHLLLRDDTDEPHRHPWSFKSFLLLGAYKEIVDGKLHKHWPFTLINRNVNEYHQVILYRFLGLRIPCLTVGKYTKKIQPWCERKTLCDNCQKIGYCVDKKYWETLEATDA